MNDPTKKLYSEVSPFTDGAPYKIGDWQKVPGVVHDDAVIKGFFGPYRWLSNFGPARVELDGVMYGAVELAYQAAKWKPEDRTYFVGCTNNESITYNRERAPNGYAAQEWEVAKIGVMRALLVQKFDPAFNPGNATRLAETGDKYIEETNWWNDRFWGKDLAGVGENNLGRLIMEVRSELSDSVT